MHCINTLLSHTLCNSPMIDKIIRCKTILVKSIPLLLGEEEGRESVRNDSFLPTNLGDSPFPHSHSMWNNTAFIMSIVKSSSQVQIRKYCYFEWSARLHSNRFGVFMFLFTIFQSFRPWKAKFNVNLWKTVMEIKKLAKRFQPPCSYSRMNGCYVLSWDRFL